MKDILNKKTEERQAPALIAVHSYNGRRMSPEEKKKFIDGALTTADNASNSFEEQIVEEDKWV